MNYKYFWLKESLFFPITTGIKHWSTKYNRSRSSPKFHLFKMLDQRKHGCLCEVEQL